MTKSFQKTLIAASVGAVLAAGSFSAVAATPGTTNLLFPFVTAEAGSYTFISISNNTTGLSGAKTPTAGGNFASSVPYHFTYSTKATTAATDASCSHIDGDGFASANDLMQFEIRNQVPFTAFGGTSTPKFLPTSFTGQRGMLIVNNAAGASTYGSGNTYVGATLYGEARIINTATGLAFGYSTDDLHTNGATTASALNFTVPTVGTTTAVSPSAVGTYTSTAAGGPDNTIFTPTTTLDLHGTDRGFYTQAGSGTASNDNAGNSIGGVASVYADRGVAVGSSKVVSWFPDPAVSTTFYVLPLHNENVMAFNGNATATYQAQDASSAGPNVGFAGHYNNKEGFQSSNATQKVTCHAAFTRKQLLGDGNEVYSANGGWAVLKNVNEFKVAAATTEVAANAAVATLARNALVYKFETTSGFGNAVSFITRAPIK